MKMSQDGFNMSLRRFLKRVGVTSQQQIEEAVRTAGSGSGRVNAKVVLTVGELGLEHVVEGEIELPDDA